MTTGNGRKPMERKIPRQDAGQMSWLLGWPILTLTFLLFPALAAMAAASVAEHPYATAAASVADWLLGGGAEHDVEMASGFGFLAVMATIVIGIAFSLPPEGVQALPKKNRRLIEFLTLGITLGASSFSALVLWVVLWRQVTLELILLLLSAWFVSVVAGLVELKRPVAERVSAARREKEKLHSGATSSGFVEGTKVTLRQRVGAESVYWLIPLVGLPLLSGTGLVWDYGGSQIDDRAWAFVLLVGWGAGVVAIAWRMTAPFPPHKRSDQVLSWTFRVTGLIVMILVPLGATLARLWAFAVLSALSVVVVIALYIVVTPTIRSPFVKTIRDAATVKRLAQADDWYEKALQELDDERAIERSTSTSQSGPQPIIRIEVFRRRARRHSPEDNN